MKYENLSETVSIKIVSETDTNGVFEIDGLFSGYGVTVGNALRRVLLSSLPGAAITQVKIKGANHEFGTLPNIQEDIVEIILNLKRIRFRMHTSEPQVLSLHAKGETAVTAGDIKTNAEVEIITPDAHIATITTKSGEFEMELTIEKGLGYVPVEGRKAEKLPIGVIALDAIFSPVTNVNFTVENMRIEERTDYNKIRISITTDSSITPSYAIQKAGAILADHFTKVGSIAVKEIVLSLKKETESKPVKKPRAIKSKKKSEE
jgi:DNA-directed RNA polymerase subunit alpha